MSKQKVILPDYIRHLAGRELDGGYVLSGNSNDPPTLCGDGQGASAYVLKALGSMGNYKAVKVLKKERITDLMSRDRFLGEIEKLRKVRHPNIISIENLGNVDTLDQDGNYSLPYYVMEFIEETVVRTEEKPRFCSKVTRILSYHLLSKSDKEYIF